MKYYVYTITSPSGKIYVGCSTNPQHRFYNHAKAPTKIGAAIRKYGKCNCELVIVEEFYSRACALRFESSLIESLNTRYPEGYNFNAGGGGCTPKSRPMLDLPVNEIADLYLKGERVKNIAKKYGVCVSTIIKRVAVSGVPRRPEGRQW